MVKYEDKFTPTHYSTFNPLSASAIIYECESERFIYYLLPVCDTYILAKTAKYYSQYLLYVYIGPETGMIGPETAANKCHLNRPACGDI